MTLGQTSLNLSFLMYMFLYLPQVIHNQKQANLVELSKWMHLTLYLGYSLDLLYGFGNNLPWQYRTVSAIGWVLLTIQHLQLIHHFKHARHPERSERSPEVGTVLNSEILRAKRRALDDVPGVMVFYSVLVFVSVLLVWFISEPKYFANLPILYIGYTAQIAFVIAFIPQILKSKRLQSAQALNIFYVLLCLFLAILDGISAWQLEWGWPNQLGSCLIILLTSTLLIQYYRYQFSKRKGRERSLLQW